MVDEADVDAVCISVVAPSTVIHARYLCAKLRAQLPNLKIAVGLWGATENITQAAQRLRDSGANKVVTTLNDAVLQLSADAEERAWARKLPHDLDISQAKDRSSEAPVGTTVNS